LMNQGQRIQHMTWRSVGKGKDGGGTCSIPFPLCRFLQRPQICPKMAIRPSVISLSALNPNLRSEVVIRLDTDARLRDVARPTRANASCRRNGPCEPGRPHPPRQPGPRRAGKVACRLDERPATAQPASDVPGVSPSVWRDAPSQSTCCREVSTLRLGVR
jgi:hypothetical protein